MKKIFNGYAFWLILILILAIVGLFVSGGFSKEIQYDIKDRCGPIVNLVSHTIQNDVTCKVQCRDRCEVDDLKYSSHLFIEAERGCHNCTCSCKSGLFGG